MKLTNRPLYLVTDYTELSDEQFFSAIEQGCQNGVGLVQLRQKEGTSREIFELAQQVKAITDKYRVTLLIDDRLDIAQAVDAAGVHLGKVIYQWTLPAVFSDLEKSLARLPRH